MIPIGQASTAGNLTFKSTATIVAKEGISMGAGAGAQKLTTDVTGNDTAGMVAGMVASGVTAKGLNGIEAEANKLAKAPKGIDGVTEEAGNLAEDAGKVVESGSNSNPTFATEDKMISHFEKHGGEFKGIFNSADEYLQGAQDVMKNGYKVEYIYKGETRIGYVQFMGNNSKGNAKFAFVGTNNDGYITTFHTESGKTFWKMLNGENIPIINPK